MSTDYYELLGVSRQATPDEIKKSFRRLARESHPDANPNDPDAEARFKDLSKAYEVLGDPERRAQYDRFGADGASSMGDPFAGGGLGDLFDAFFGGQGGFGGGGGRPSQSGPPRGPDLEATVELAFTEAVFGAEKTVQVRTAVSCDDCEGTGAQPGTSAETCGDCSGAGEVRTVRNSVLGQIVSSAACRRCQGEGKVVSNPCETCQGDGRVVTDREYTVSIPAGVDTGATLRLSGRGAVGTRSGPAGDLYVKIRVQPHETLARHGNDLHSDLSITFAQAALGHHVKFETLDGEEDLVIPQGTQSGRVFRLRKRGVPHLEGPGRGDLNVRVIVVTPTDLAEEQIELMQKFADLRGEEVFPADSGLLSRIRTAFK